MQSQQRTVIDRDAASRALIDLIADLTWSERQQAGMADVRRTRQEAMGLLPRIANGDHEAARRAMELVHAAGGRSA